MDHASTEEDDDFPPVLKEYAAMLKANDILNMFDLRRSVRDGADSEVTNFANYLAETGAAEIQRKGERFRFIRAIAAAM